MNEILRLRVGGLERADLEKAIEKLKSTATVIEREIAPERRILSKESAEFTIKIPRDQVIDLLENERNLSAKMCMMK